MLYIKTKLSKWSGAKQKFLFAVVTLLSAPLWSDDVTQLRGCSLVKGAIFFKVQISLQTIKQAFATHIYSVWPHCIYSCCRQIRRRSSVSSVSHFPGSAPVLGYLEQR